MAFPKEPTKPTAPYKPTPPSKQLSNNTPVGSFEVDKYSSYSVNEFLDQIKLSSNKNEKDLNLDDISFSFDIEQESTYYDETIIKINVNVYSTDLRDNLNYENQYDEYLRKFEKYEKDYLKYKDKLKEYKQKLKEYKIAVDEYRLENAKKQIKFLEDKLKK